VPDIGYLQELDVGQKRSLACRHLERGKAGAQARAKTILSMNHADFSYFLNIINDRADTLEMLLLLLWRHLVYYCEGHHINNPDLKTSTSHAMRFLSSPDAQTFQSEAGIRLAPTLQRLSSLDLVRGTL
jgi:nuclear pore complex protein Nup205